MKELKSENMINSNPLFYNTIVYCLLFLDNYRNLQLGLLNFMTSQLNIHFFVGVFFGFHPPPMIQSDQAVVVVQSVCRTELSIMNQLILQLITVVNQYNFIDNLYTSID